MNSSESSRAPSSSQRRRKPLAARPENDWDRYQHADRSAWWRHNITRFPSVGQYDPKEVDSLQRQDYPSSTFRSSGRKRDLGMMASGGLLMPGAYSHRSFTDELAKSSRSYSFKNSSKSSLEALTEGMVDKKLQNLSPGQYNVESFQSIRAPLQPAAGSSFKSRTKRTLPEFEPRPGPAPGEYDTARTSLSCRANRSSFRSACPRFASSHSKVPAPGSYSGSYQSPMPANLMRLGRQHGLFFSTSFYP